jgi:sigma-B regulation protein RsbU (phosphoserine phosphatase)
MVNGPVLLLQTRSESVLPLMQLGNTLDFMSEVILAEDSEIAKRICRVIFEHAARISRESDISKLLNLNADLARDLIGADRCSVWLVDERTGELWTKVAHGVSELRIPAGTGLIGNCITSDSNIVVNDTGSDERFLRRVDQSSGYRTDSVLAVPLHADGRVIGAMQVLNKPGGFSNHDAELLNFMAAYSAAEIQSERLRHEAETARLLRRELDLARDVQRNLLPKELPPVKGIDYYGFSRAAKSVGGDYFDFLDLPEGSFSFTLGDVSGKGMPAAVLMASIQALLRSHLLRQARPLSKLVAEVGQTVFLCSSIDRYSTLFCGLLDADRRALTYVNAGHPPAMILRQAQTGEIDRASSTGMPIGMLPSIEYGEQTIQVSPGDLIVCISDGIAEVLNTSGTMWDEIEVEKVVLDNQEASTSEVVQAIVDRVDAYAAGTEQYDDMTIVAVRILS